MYLFKRFKQHTAVVVIVNYVWLLCATEISLTFFSPIGFIALSINSETFATTRFNVDLNALENDAVCVESALS